MPLLYRIGGCRSVIVLPVGVKSLLLAAGCAAAFLFSVPGGSGYANNSAICRQMQSGARASAQPQSGTGWLKRLIILIHGITKRVISILCKEIFHVMICWLKKNSYLCPRTNQRQKIRTHRSGFLWPTLSLPSLDTGPKATV